MMIKDVTSKVSIALFGLFLIMKTALSKELVAAPFNVVPGGQTGTHVEKWKDIACEFTYVCQGGTLEEWEMLINREADGTFVCKVARPDGSTTSYLFFQSFQLEIKGANLLAAVVLGENGQQCGKEEYTVDTDNNLVKSDSGFKAHLNKVFAVFKQGRVDL